MTMGIDLDFAFDSPSLIDRASYHIFKSLYVSSVQCSTEVTILVIINIGFHRYWGLQSFHPLLVATVPTAI